MRSPLLHAAAARLALAAMLALCFAPSVSRLLAAGDGASGWVQLCTMSGLKQVWHDGAGAVPSGQPTGDDCAYCPLLAAMGAAVAVVLLCPPLRHREFLPRVLVAGPASRHVALGLGARGPPLLA